MSAAPIDLSAGLVQQPPAAGAGSVDLSAGLVGPQPVQTPEDIPSPHESMLSTIGNGIADFGQGEVREAAKTLSGVDSMVSKIPYVGKALTTPLVGGATSEQAQSDLSAIGNAPSTGAMDTAGGYAESALEFLLGDASLKGLSLADKLKQVQPVLKAAEKFPVMAKALMTAMRTGTVAAGQTLAKTGGDVGQAVEQGALGAVTGGVMEGGAGKLNEAIEARSPQVTNVAGENIVTPKPAQVPPEVQQAQTAGKNVITKSAQAATRENVGLVNDRPHFAMEGTVQGEPTGGMTIPKPPIVDVPAAVARVQSFGDAADEVEKAAKRSYDVIDATTNGKFNAIRDDVSAARKEVWNAGSPESRDAAQLRLENATNRMQQLFEDSSGKVSQQDWQSANQAWNNAKTLRQVHNAVESTFDTDAGFSQRSGTYRGFNGNQLRQNLNRLTQKIGEPELNRVIGRDNMDNLRKVAELTRTNADRAKFGAAVQKVGSWLTRDSAAAGAGALLGHATGFGVFGGAATGEAALMAARKVMQMVATNPRVGQQLTFAVESGARPEYYAPLIGKMIRDAEEEGKQQ